MVNFLKELWLKKKVGLLAFALIFMVLGIVIVVIPNPQIGLMTYHPSFDVDLTNVKWVVGPALILVSLFFIVGIVRSKSEMVHSKCIKCGKVTLMDWIEEHKCKKCGGRVERLTGFFERHPECKDRNEI